MWLINTSSLELQHVVDSTQETYIVLSHTWADGEVTFQELNQPASRSKASFAKIENTCSLARKQGFEWAWVDTCCIIQTHHRRQRPTKGVAYAAENGGRTYIAFQYERINIFLPSAFPSENP
jgi:hypothetical protein